MLNVADAIKQRRSIRAFNRRPVSNETIMEMLEAARLAPSASNSQPWRFVVVTEAEEKKKLRELCFNQKFIEEAGVDFVVCADLSVYSKEGMQKRRQESVDAGVVADAANTIDPAFYQRYQEMMNSDLTQQITPATANTYIAAEHLILMATALGLGSCWVGGISSFKAIRDLCSIPRGILVLGVIAVGYYDNEPKARPRLPMKEILLRPFPKEK